MSTWSHFLPELTCSPSISDRQPTPTVNIPSPVHPNKFPPPQRDETTTDPNRQSSLQSVLSVSRCFLARSRGSSALPSRVCHNVHWFEWLDCEADHLTGSHQIRSFDLFLSAVQALVTFSVAYPASVALGSVLLQTSPARGLASGRMESFLRVMKEVRFLRFNPPPPPLLKCAKQPNRRSRGTLKSFIYPHRTSGN